jgi:hypothetical protein
LHVQRATQPLTSKDPFPLIWGKGQGMGVYR